MHGDERTVANCLCQTARARLGLFSSFGPKKDWERSSDSGIIRSGGFRRPVLTVPWPTPVGGPPGSPYIIAASNEVAGACRVGSLVRLPGPARSHTRLL